jgi:hypothetical protein
MTPKAKRILYGLLIAAGAAVAFVVALAIGFGVWVTRPGELIDPARLLHAQTTGYAEWSLRLDDPGTEGFVDILLEAARAMPNEATDALSPFIGGWLLDAQEAKARRDLEEIFPMVLAWTVNPGAVPDQDLQLLSLSSKQLGNRLVLADWIAKFALARSPRSSVEPYRDENIYQLQYGDRRADDLRATFFARRGAIFATSNLDTARRAVDLLAEAEAEGRPATELDRTFQRTREADALRAAVTNEHGELARLWTRLTGEAAENPRAWEAVRSASLGGGLEADGTFKAVMELVGSSGLAAAGAAAIPSSLRLDLGDRRLELQLSAAPTDDGLRIDVLIPDLAASLTESMSISMR